MLFSYPNVWNTCLQILHQRGYQLYLLGDINESGSFAACTWNAEKNGMKFRGDNPIELLGLVAIFDHCRPTSDYPYWWRTDGPDVFAEVVNRWRAGLPPPSVPSQD